MAFADRVFEDRTISLIRRTDNACLSRVLTAGDGIDNETLRGQASDRLVNDWGNAIEKVIN